MATFIIRRADGLQRSRDDISQEYADDLFFEAISKAHKVIQQNDNVKGNRCGLIRFAKLTSPTSVFTVMVYK